MDVPDFSIGTHFILLAKFQIWYFTVECVWGGGGGGGEETERETESALHVILIIPSERKTLH